MAGIHVERRLAAILAADVVGYARLVERDEQGTLARLRAHRKELIEPLLAEHHGRIVKLMGDGALGEFASVVDAVACAIAIQLGMAEREKDVRRAGTDPASDRGQSRRRGGRGRRPLWRRGERCRQAGRIGRAGRDHGVGHGLRPSSGQARLRPDPPRRTTAQEHRAAGPGLSGKAPDGRHPRGEPAAGSSRAPSAPPSIAVLPFLNLSGDPEQGYFSDGITEDIITELSRFRPLAVIARTSSFQFRDKALSVQEIGRALGAAFIVEGSVRRLGERLRITAQLIEGGNRPTSLGRTVRS